MKNSIISNRFIYRSVQFITALLWLFTLPAYTQSVGKMTEDPSLPSSLEMIRMKPKISSFARSSVMSTMALTPPAPGTYNLYSDSLALLELYTANGGGQWTNHSNWTLGNVATWYGVTVSGDRVTQLILPANGLNGTIPTSIGNLTALTYLDLSRNAIHGSIPSSIGNLTSLWVLFLYTNQLSGPLPPSMGSLNGLVYLHLYKNNLEGDLPSTFGQLVNLQYFSFHLNNLSGNFDWLGNMGNLVQFYFYGNPNLDCTLPSNIGNLTHLTRLMGGGFLGDRVYQHQKLHGSIPASIGSCNQLQQIYLDNSDLSGPVPTSLNQLSKLFALSLFNNTGLSGDFNAFLGTTNMKYLYLFNTGIGGNLSNFAGNSQLESIDVTNTQATGQLSNLSSSTNLQWVGISGLQGVEVPSWITSKQKLYYLNASNNGLTSTPDFSTHANKANLELYVQNNKLDFADLEPLFTGNGVYPFKIFNYSDQAVVGSSQAFTYNVLSNHSISYTAPGAYNNYQWQKNNSGTWQDLSGANSAQLDFPVVAPSQAGEYRLKITNQRVTGIELLSASTTISVEGVVGAPSIGDKFVCPNVPITLTATPSNGGIVKWYSTLTDPIPLATGDNYFIEEGLSTTTQFYVTQELQGVPSERLLITVTVTPLPEMIISGDATICLGQSTLINVDTNSSVLWSHDLGHQQSHTVSPIETTTYTVTAESSNGCKKIMELTVNVNNPVATISPASPTVCSDISLVFSGSGGVNYQWSDGRQAQDIVVTPTTTTTLSLTTTDEAGCTATAETLITVKQNAWVEASPDQTICKGKSAVIFVNGNAVSYEWGANLGSETVYNVSPSQSYTYGVIGTAANGCQQIDYVNVFVNDLPNVSITPSSVEICPGAPMQFEASGGSYFAWSTGEITKNIIVHPTTAQTYSVQVSDSYGCTNSASSTISIRTDCESLELNNSMNWVKETTALVKGKVDDFAVISSPDNQKQIQWQYVDGLGRTMQGNKVKHAPSGKDIIAPFVYDQFGRQSVQYLAFTSAENGLYKNNSELVDPVTHNYIGVAAEFYAPGSNNKVADDSRPYLEDIYEASPLNRIVQQFGAGEAWKSGNKRVVHSYQLNVHGTGAGQEKIIAWQINSSNLPVRSTAVAAGYLLANGYYASGQLFIKSTTDESDKQVREYADKSGKVILKKVQVATNPVLSNRDHWAQTYYIYDDLGNLRFVLSPELTKIIYQNDTYNPTTGNLANLAYQYNYDGRQRVVSKQLPGNQPEYIVYDKRDRIILTQNGVQRATATKYWTFTKYDELNRPVMTGIKDTSVLLTQEQMQAAVNTHLEKVSSRLNEEYTGNTTDNVHGYSNKAYPVRTGGASEIDPNKYLTVTYYDQYNFRSLWAGSYNYFNESLTTSAYGVSYSTPTSESTLVKGLITGSKIKILDGGMTGDGSWIRSVNYYDNKNRSIQVLTDNITGGRDRATSLWDINDKVLKSKITHGVVWKDMVGVEATPTGLTRTLASTGWTAGAASVDQLPANQNGWVEVRVEETNKLRMIGLSEENTNSHFNTIDYAVNLNLGDYTVYENGTNRGKKSTIVTGDIIRIERNGTSIRYLKNGVVVFTSTVPSTTSLMVDVSLNEVGATLPQLNYSFKNQSPRVVVRTFEYDNGGRLINVWHKVDAQAEIVLLKNEYNELGMLVDKKLHSTTVSGSDAMQSIDYRYNIRGWLTKINESDINAGTSDQSNAGEARDFFGMELGYNSDIGVGNSAMFNGNISAVKWSKNQALGATKESSYIYSYDQMNRITSAAYKEKSTSWDALTGDAFSETGFSYDLNGNVLTLKRYDKRGSSQPMDNLVLTYSYGSTASQGNKLLNVIDAGDVNRGFLDGTTATTEYSYNENGAMISDANKGVNAANAITYNYLNLPEVVRRGTSNSIRYIYDAVGRKLSQIATYNTSNKRTDYIGDYQYENGELQFIRHEEGRIVMSNQTLVYRNEGDDVTSLTASNAVLELVTQKTNQTYLKVTASGTTARTGLLPMTEFNGIPGQRYKIRAKGYRDKGTAAASNPVYLFISVNGVDQAFPGATLASSSTTEAWTEQIITLPAGTGSPVLRAGIIWNTTVAAGEIFYVNDFEIVTLNQNISPEYQYTIKDHLGNTRVAFTTKNEVDESIVTFETANRASEEGKFLRYGNARLIESTWFDRTNGAVKGYAQRLNGTTNEKYGIAHSVSVMPGDKINAEVYVKYLDPNSSNRSAALSTLISQIANSSASAGTVVDGGGYSSSGTSFPFAGLGDTSPGTTPGPKGYLNWLIFDRDYNLLGGARKKMTDVAREYGQDVNHERVFSPDINITEPGYVYVYVSNEEEPNPTPVEIYFDDMKITHTKSPVITTQDFYPFGLAFNTYYRENTLPDQYGYNGYENQEELDLGWVDYGARMYMPEIGRWNAPDPQSEVAYEWSPYSYAYNDPVQFIDDDGQIVNVPGMILGALADYLGQVGGNYFIKHYSFKESLTNDINPWSIGFAGAVGAFTGGLDTFKNFITSPVGSEVLKKVMKWGVDFFITVASDMLADFANDGKYDVWKSLTGGLLGSVAANLLPMKMVEALEKKLLDKATKSAAKVAKARAKLSNKMGKKKTERVVNKLFRAMEQNIKYTAAYNGVHTVMEAFKAGGINALTQELFLRDQGQAPTGSFSVGPLEVVEVIKVIKN